MTEHYDSWQARPGGKERFREYARQVLAQRAERRGEAAPELPDAPVVDPPPLPFEEADYDLGDFGPPIDMDDTEEEHR